MSKDSQIEHLKPSLRKTGYLADEVKTLARENRADRENGFPFVLIKWVLDYQIMGIAKLAPWASANEMRPRQVAEGLTSTTR